MIAKKDYDIQTYFVVLKATFEARKKVRVCATLGTNGSNNIALACLRMDPLSLIAHAHACLLTQRAYVIGGSRRKQVNN